MSKRILSVGVAFAIALALFAPSLRAPSVPVYAAPPGGACDVNGNWFGFTLGTPPQPVTLTITQNLPHQNFTWVANAVAPQGPIVAQGNGVVKAGSPDFTFHIEGHGTAGSPLKNVHAEGTLTGCGTPLMTASFTYEATYTDGTSSSGPGSISNFNNT